jgi:hypothetical protein
MADNLTTQSATPATVPSASVIATDDVTGVHFQKVKLDVGGDGVSVPASGDATNGLDVDVTRVQGTVAVTGTFYQATQPVSGTVAVTGAYQATQPVSLATAPTTPVTGTFWQATQPVSGTVTATGPLTDTELRATAVPVSGTVTATGPLTDAQLRAATVPVSGTVAVTGVPAAITGFATETTLLAVKGKTDNIPALGAATVANSIPVTMASNQSNILVAINNTPNVSNTGTFAVQANTAPIASMTKGVSTATNGTATFQVVPAVATKQLAITSISVVNTGTTATLITIQDGTSPGTALYATMAPPGGGSNMTLPTPILTTAGNALYAQCSAASASVTVCAAGYSV